MANLSPVQLRLRSVQSIAKITQSMKMIASTKLTRAQRAMEVARVYGATSTSILSCYISAKINLEKIYFLRLKLVRVKITTPPVSSLLLLRIVDFAAVSIHPLVRQPRPWLKNILKSRWWWLEIKPRFNCKEP